jgi:hypothetical protein
MSAGWQDIVVTIVAFGAAVTVVWRTLGTWADSKPGSSASPGCDHCAIKKMRE